MLVIIGGAELFTGNLSSRLEKKHYRRRPA
jgi:hypothetical protein